jgi:hypothetical protein
MPRWCGFDEENWQKVRRQDYGRFLIAESDGTGRDRRNRTQGRQPGIWRVVRQCGLRVACARDRHGLPDGAPHTCTIAAWNITVNAGTATFDIWKIATGTAIPTSSNSITASAQPAISTGTAIHSTTLTGWTTSVSANDIVAIQLKTVATATFASMVVECN